MPAQSRRMRLCCCPRRSNNATTAAIDTIKSRPTNSPPSTFTAQHSPASGRQSAAEVSPTLQSRPLLWGQWPVHVALEPQPGTRLSDSMRLLLPAFLFFARLLDALPTGRDLGSEHNAPPSHHHTDPPVVAQSDGASAHSELSWSLSDIEPLSPVRWDAPPLSFQHSLPPMSASDHADTGHSAPSIAEPVSKRLKKYHDANFVPRRRRSDLPYRLKRVGLSTQAGPSQTPSTDNTSPTYAPQSSSARLAARLKRQPADEWKKAGLAMTEEAKPLDVKAALEEVNSKGGINRSRMLRSSILQTAVATVRNGCTTKSDVIQCMKEKYGENLVKLHDKALGRIINKNTKDKGTYGVATSSKGTKLIDPYTHTADGNDNRSAEKKKAKQDPLSLRLPPTGRKEPPLKDEDVGKYQEGLKHLDYHQLGPGEYVKQAYKQFEQAPDRWHKMVPKKAIDLDLHNKDVGEAMFTQIKKVRNTKVHSVSTIVLKRLADCVTDGTDKGKQARTHQLYHTSSKTRAARILSANIRTTEIRAAKALAASRSHPRPH